MLAATEDPHTAAHTADLRALHDTHTLPLSDIAPSGTAIQAARRARFKPEAITELARSIAAQGLLQPLLVRPVIRDHAAQKPWEIIAGERRWLACREAGLTQVPVIVRAIGDDDLVELQLVENLQREGLHELEEAEGYGTLMQLKSLTADQVADKIGRSRSYVYARLKLLSLAPEARQAFYAGQLDASRALHVARVVNPKLQARALKLATETGYDSTRPRLSVRDLVRELQGDKFAAKLDTARFDREDASLLPGTPACSVCPHRTGNAPDLFNPKEDPQLCTHPECFSKKTQAAALREEERVKEQGIEVIKGEAAKKIAPRKDKLVGYVDLDDLCWVEERYGPSSAPKPERVNFEPDEEGEEDYRNALEDWQQGEELPKRTFRAVLGEAAARLPVTHLQDPKDKRIRQLVPYKAMADALREHDITLPAHQYRPDPAGYGMSRSETPAEKAAREEKQKADEQKREAELAWRRRVAAACWAQWKGPLKRDDLETIADGLLEDYSHKLREAVFGGKPVPDTGKMTDAQLGVIMLLAVLSDEMQPWGTNTAPKGLLALAARCKVNAQALRKDPAAAAAAEKPAAKKATRATAWPWPGNAEDRRADKPAASKATPAKAKKPAAKKRGAKK